MDNLVLIIEDNQSIADLEKRYLERDGFAVMIANRGADAIAMIEDGAHPDILIIDYRLPDMSGVDLMQRIRESGREIPAIIVTAAGNEQVAVSAMKLGAMDYIVKDRETIKLLPAACREVLKRFNLESENARLLDEMKILNSELIESNRRLDELSKRDELTGCFNRRYLMETLRYEITRSARYREPMSFALFDVDLFKRVNDTCGHSTGDLVLKQFVQLLTQRLRKTDVLGRYGGEEFGILLTMTNLESAIYICEEIRMMVENYSFGFDHSPLKITTSVGVATRRDKMTKEELIETADRGLYKAKQAGRNLLVALQKAEG